MRLGAGTMLEARGLLFDMDGTLVDSVAAVERTWRGWATRHGLDPAPIIEVAHGRRAIETVRMFATGGMDVEAEAARLAEIERGQTEGIREVAGAGALLRSLPRDCWAVVTSADRALATSRLALAGLPMPDVLVAAEDVAAGKPDPEGYRAAAHRLGLSADECIVFEDAAAGIAAGRRSGAAVVVVATTLPSSALAEETWIADFTATTAVAVAGPQGKGYRLDVRFG